MDDIGEGFGSGGSGICKIWRQIAYQIDKDKALAKNVIKAENILTRPDAYLFLSQRIPRYWSVPQHSTKATTSNQPTLRQQAKALLCTCQISSR